jgi:hypothetical protein
MQDAAMAIRLRMGAIAAMGYERAHQEHVTRFTKNRYGRLGFHASMRSRNDL